MVRKDFASAASILPTIPAEEHNRIARFLEAQGYKREALAVATDPEHRCSPLYNYILVYTHIISLHLYTRVYTRVEAQGFKREALAVATDRKHRLPFSFVYTFYLHVVAKGNTLEALAVASNPE